MARRQAHAPASTYRLQLNAGFTLRDAASVVPYLERLGVTDVYLSPVFEARAGSEHGYDIVDPTRVSRALGGRPALNRLASELRKRGMGLLLDIVPNHMAVDPANRWWADVARRGRSSRYADMFDIDWHRSTDGELVYRRFFDVDHLVGVRVEDPDVFERTHELALKLVHDGIATGLRIDHIDGLLDPAGYLRRLRRHTGAQTYVLVEKILTGNEAPPDWPVAGTTGYDFLNMAAALFVDRRGLARLDELYRSTTRSGASLPEVTYESKRHVLRKLFAREMEALAKDLVALAGQDAPSLGLSRAGARDAIEEVTARLPVYRTYIRDWKVPADDRRVVSHALRAARGHAQPGALAFLQRVLLLRAPPRRRSVWLRFVRRWQQCTGPATAKGFEDNGLYRYNRLISLNDVGADPEGTGTTSLAAFHARMGERCTRWPGTMNTTSTHDTKRGEDARLRIAALSEVADEWSRTVRGWRRLNRQMRTRAGRRFAPDANEEMLVYQALLGSWPLDGAAEFEERFVGYLTKALREAKRNTSWRQQDDEYERAATGFARGLLGSEAFMSEFTPFARKLAFRGAVSSLSHVLMKIAAPGMPDIYRGTELWDLSLVDPDNRRPVNFAAREDMLDGLDERAASDRGGLIEELLDRWDDGRIKLYVTAQALRARRAHHQLFARGAYMALYAPGAAREHVVAFARRGSGQWAIVAAPRLVASLTADGAWPVGDVWGGATVRLPRGAPGRWRDVFSGETILAKANALRLRDVFGLLPVALLEAEG